MTTDLLKAFVDKRQGQGAENATINRELAVLKRMLRLGTRTVPALVTSALPYFPKLKENPPRRGFLTQAEYDLLRPHATELWLRGLVATSYSFGQRRSELMELRCSQVIPEDNWIQLDETKNGESRGVKMTSEVRALILALIEGKGRNDFVFTRENGERVKDFLGAWKKMLEAAGVPFRLFHDMRRSAIRNMIRRGDDRDAAKKLSGHKTDHVFSRYNIQDESDAEDAARSWRGLRPPRPTKPTKNRQSGTTAFWARAGGCSERLAYVTMASVI